MGFIPIGLAGLFYSYRFLGFEGDYTVGIILMFGVAIMFFGAAGGLYFKNRKDKVGKY